MKVLHLISNWKWTERTEPAVDLALAQQAYGLQVRLVCDRAPDGIDENAEHFAREKGVTDVVAMELPKHLKLHRISKTVSLLRKMIAEYQPDIIHCHLLNAEFAASLARGKASTPMIVRSCYDPDGLEQGFRAKHLVANATDGLVLINESARASRLAATMDPKRVIVSEPGIDVERFTPIINRDAARASFGLSDKNFVIGLVSRIRKERRVDIPLKVTATLSKKNPDFRFLAVGRGRGNAVSALLELPAGEEGVTDKMVLAGYCRGNRLVDAYNAMDLLIYPVPGTDKSCRTVREALACGVPVIASNTGFLKDLIEDGKTGRLLNLDVDEFSSAVSELLSDSRKLNEMKKLARDSAEKRFTLSRQAETTASFYENLTSF